VHRVLLEAAGFRPEALQLSSANPVHAKGGIPINSLPHPV